MSEVGCNLKDRWDVWKHQGGGREFQIKEMESHV